MTASSKSPQGRPAPGVPPRLEHLDLLVLDSRERHGRSEICEVIEIRPGRVALVHGVACSGADVAAQRLVDLRTVLRNVLGRGPRDAASCAHEVNGLLLTAPRLGWYPISEQMGYICMFLGLYEDATRTLDYLNCGHGEHVILRRDGPVERLFITGLPMGMISSFPFESASLYLAPGDMLIVSSDVPEEEFEEWAPLDNLGGKSLIRRVGGMSLEGVAEELFLRIRQLSPEASTDDMAILIARGK